MTGEKEQDWEPPTGLPEEEQDEHTPLGVPPDGLIAALLEDVARR